MSTFLDEDGSLNLEELILLRPSFQAIMENGIVTDAAIEEQGQRVKDLLLKAEQELSPEHLELVHDLLAETCVAITAINIYEKQE